MILHEIKSNSVFTPTKGDICIVTCHFNFIDWNTPARNLHRFLRQQKKDNIPVFGAEAYLYKPETEGETNWIQVKATNKNICFQKEALLNLVIRNLPENFTKIIVCDHDIWFERKDWIQEASRTLDYYDFIQPFSKCIWTGRDGRELGRKYSFFKSNNSYDGHPGFAIGFKRRSFEKIWFFPYCIVGGGDTIFAGSVSANTRTARKKFYQFFEDYKSIGSYEWYKNVVNQNFFCGYMDGVIYHEYHGRKIDRKYNSRGGIIQDFDPSNMFINNNGLVEFKEGSEITMIKIHEYLKERNEDS